MIDEVWHRRERIASAVWLGLALLIVVASAGEWSASGPGNWAPTVVRPRDVLLNVAIYVAFGVSGMLALNRGGARGVMRVTGIALLLSLSVEALQLYTADRVASLTDIASAAVGTVAGASAVAWLRLPR
jgi:VanZ family protein